jgi:HSP90 family molecular chaperone
VQATGVAISDPDAALEISITVDKDAKTITLTDTGIGMSKDEMIDNLGTIARSGSKKFVNEVCMG